MAVANVVYEAVANNEDNNKSTAYASPRGWGVRHLQTFLLFICLVMAFTTRSQLSVLMVAMIDSSNQDNCNMTLNLQTTRNDTNITVKECSIKENVNDWSVYRTYEWNKSTQEIIMFSFFVGYTSMQLPMGLLAQRVGGKIPIMIALGVNGILSLCTPWIPLAGGWIATSASRFIQGMVQAAFYPSVHTMLARWAPLSERGRLTTYAYSGSQAGTVIAYQMSGLLAGSPALGWPSSFWLFGCLSLVVFGLFSWLGAASPHDHSRISTEELVYIIEDCDADAVPKKRKTPWLDIFKSPSIWGILITQAGSTTGYVMIMTEIPLYMSNVLGVDIKKNGLYSSLPYIAMYVMSISLGTLADFVRNRNYMKTVNIRRAANTIGLVGSGIFLLAFIYVRNTLLAVCLLILSVGAIAGTHVGFMVNLIDLAPNFAGSIMALSNTVGHLTSLAVPFIISYIVTNVKDQHQWQIVFFIVIGFQFVSNTIFVVLAKGEVQPWNYYGDEVSEPEGSYPTLKDEKNEGKEKK